MSKLVILMLLSGIFSSCAKMSYIFNQGVGQASLEWNGRDNKEVLKDESVKEEHKKKIQQIINYKKFFYTYFGKKPTGIYDQTTFLKDPAVTYLVIASPPDKIKPLEHSFPIVGRFPYLGFFDLKDAKAFGKDLRDQGLETFVRPVYAYSTLDQWIFDDNILSSFFSYDEIELAELIFHELFHTIFFVKSEVAVNENLAQFFSRELVFEYFKYGDLERQKYIQEKAKEKRLIQKIVELTAKLQELYMAEGRRPSDAGQIRESFLKDVFIPQIGQTCSELGLAKCWPLDKEWNNARFAAFLTYEAGQNKIEKLKEKHFPDLKTFYAYLVEKSESYGGDSEGSFEDYILKEK